MAVDYDRLIDASVALRAVSRPEWDNFVAAVQEHAAQVMAEMNGCPIEMLQRAQGMSMQASKFATVVVNAPKLYEQRLEAIASRKMVKRDGKFKSAY